MGMLAHWQQDKHRVGESLGLLRRKAAYAAAALYRSGSVVGYDGKTVRLLLSFWLGISLFGVQFFPSTRPVYAESTQPIATVIDTTEDAKAMGYPDGRKIARDANGNLYVAYRKKFKLDRLTAYHIFVARSTDDGRSWTVLNGGQPIEAVGDQNQRVPTIAIDRHGTLHVVWYGKDGKGYAHNENQIKYVYSTDGGASWSTWRNIAYVAGYAAESAWQEHPTLYIDLNDALYVVWEGYDSYYRNAPQVKFIRSTDGGQQWSTWQNVAPTATNHSRPTIVGQSQSALYILAYGRMGSQQQIIYSRSTDGGLHWEAWLPVAPSMMEQRHVSAAVDSHGTLHVVWRQQPAALGADMTKTQIHYTNFDGKVWQTPLRIPSAQAAAQTFPSIGIGTTTQVDPQTQQRMTEDTIWIVWSETAASFDYPNDELASGQIYAIVQDAQGWHSPQPVATGGQDTYASLARSGVNNAIDVVWLDNQVAQKPIQFTQLTTAALATGRQPGLLSIQPTTEPRLVLSVVDGAFLQQLGLINFAFAQGWPREVQTLAMILGIVSGYILLKFLYGRWLSAPLPAPSNPRR